MFYDFALTIPAGTTQADPTTEWLELDHGIITDVFVDFPAGCRGYVDCVIIHSESQVYPKNKQGSFHGEEYTIPIKEHYPLIDEPYRLKFIGWSPSATYDHEITVQVNLLKEDEVELLIELLRLYRDFFKLLTAKPKVVK